MRIDRSEDGDEDPSHADAGRTPDAGSLESKRSPESAEANVEQAEPRTRNEYADHVRPQDSDSPSDPLSADQESRQSQDQDSQLGTNSANSGGEESDIPEEESPEATTLRREEQPDESRAVRQNAGDQPQAPDDTAWSADQHDSPDDPPEHLAESEDSNNAATRRAEEEGVPGPHPDDPESNDSIRSLSREERAKHIAHVLERLDKADEQGLSAEDLHTVDPAKEIWSTERTLRHSSLLDDVYAQAADVPCEYKAIIAGGLSGAGKTTVLANHPEIDRSQYLTINPDNIKEEMARRDMIPEVEGLSPMEASDLVHEESSYLARQLALRAQADGKNLIWDITMSDQTKTETRIQNLREAGYTRIDGIFVEIPIEVSLRRTEERYWSDQNKWLAGQGLGGRLVPPDVILRQKDDEWGSCNRKTFEAIKSTFENWEIKDNSMDDHPALLIGHGQKKETDNGNS